MMLASRFTLPAARCPGKCCDSAPRKEITGGTGVGAAFVLSGGPFPSAEPSGTARVQAGKAPGCVEVGVNPAAAGKLCAFPIQAVREQSDEAFVGKKSNV